MYLHLDAGACSTGMTREKVSQLVQAADRDNLITYSRDRVKTPTPPRRAYHSSTGMYHCHLCSRRCPTLPGLQQHLASARHAGELYCCPPGQECGKTFPALSALVQHMDAAECGVAGDWYVRDRFNTIVDVLKPRPQISFYDSDDSEW